MNKLQNKVAVITGANSGIGLATAKLFLKQGAKLVLAGRRENALREATKDLKGEYITVVADVSKEKDNVLLIKKTVEKYGKIDVLYLNAGIAPVAPTADVTIDHYNEVFDTNVKGPILTIKEALPHINDTGSILFTNSIVHQRI
jgi:NADP-dependent 3-hydroxy acid dehydrogenase YdfG